MSTTIPPREPVLIGWNAASISGLMKRLSCSARTNAAAFLSPGTITNILPASGSSIATYPFEVMSLCKVFVLSVPFLD